MLSALAGELSRLDGFRDRHPLAPASHSQGVFSCLFELQSLLSALSGQPEVSVAPLDCEQARLAGLLMLRARQRDIGEPCGPLALGVHDREAWVRGARRAGFQTVGWEVGMELPERAVAVVVDAEACADLRLGQDTPVFVDGASAGPLLPALMPELCRVDLISLDFAAQFDCPAPAAAAIAASERLAPYLPLPLVGYDGEQYSLNSSHRQKSIGRLAAYDGNVPGLLNALVRIRSLGAEGLARRVTEAMLHRGYVAARMQAAGVDLVTTRGAEVVVRPRVPAQAIHSALRREGVPCRLLPMEQLALRCAGPGNTVEAERQLEFIIATLSARD